MNNIDNYSTISKESSLTGELNFNSDTMIYGKVDGILRVSDTNTLLIEKNSQIKGNIYCHDIEILGEVHGSIYSRGKVTIRSAASIHGNIKSQELVIYPGAELNLEAHSEKDL